MLKEVIMYSNHNSIRKKRRPQKRYAPKKKKNDYNITAVFVVTSLILVAVIALIIFGISKISGDADESGDIEISIVRPEDLRPADDSSTTDKSNDTAGKKIICIDPGHGFADVGTVVNSYMHGKTEADFNLTFSVELKAALEEMGFIAVLTHDGQKIPDGYDYDGDGLYSATEIATDGHISERRDFAMAQNPDYFISVHCDSFSDESVKGMRIYYSSDSNESSSAVDKLVERMKSVTSIYPNTTARKFPQDPENVYAVVKKWGSTPAMLCELGFVSSPEDAACLLDIEWHKKTARSIAEGISDYFS